MTLTFDWFLPTSGDGRTIFGRGHSLPLDRPGASDGARPGRASAYAAEREPDLEYLGQVARAAERLGFAAVLTPAGTWGEDAWLATAALITATSRLKFLVAFRPGLISPTLAAQMAASYQRLSGGRLLLNVVTGGQADEQRRFGDYLSHDERYARTGEFLAIVRGAWSGQPFDFSGQYYQVEQATVMRPPDPVPGVFFGGSSPAAGPVAARYVDTYLTWGEPPAQVAEKLTWMRGLAAAQGRELRFGIRLHVITRDTEQEAWAVADTLLSQLDPDEISAASAVLGHTESAGQDRMHALHAAYRRSGAAGDLEIYPHLEEAYWFGEEVLPELRRRGVWAEPGSALAGPGPALAAPGPGIDRELEGAGHGPS